MAVVDDAAVERRVDAALEFVDGEEAAGGLQEFTMEVLTECRREETLLLLNECRVHVLGVGDGGFDAMPAVGLVVPDGEEQAGLAAGRAEHPHLAVGPREAAREVADDFVVNEGGFVDDDDIGGVADDRSGVAGDGEDAGAVG